MKCLTLRQPWATLLALRAKKHETRSWSTNYRGPIAIHAGKNRDHVELLEKQPFRCELNRAGYLVHDDFEFGAVIAVGKLVSCQPITLDLARGVSETERLFGDWSPGQLAWELQDIKMVGPYPCRGYQRLWNWTGREKPEDWSEVT